MPTISSAPSAASSARAILPYPFSEAIIPNPSLPPIGARPPPPDAPNHLDELVSEDGYRQGPGCASVVERRRAPARFGTSVGGWS
jgi:hypothetical protein